VRGGGVDSGSCGHRSSPPILPSAVQ
jgi:hypothetical protein